MRAPDAPPAGQPRPSEGALASSTLLLLVDGRLPTGAHGHSGGVEAAVQDGRVFDQESLESYLIGRLATTGLCDAALAAAATLGIAPLPRLVGEALARCASPALRRASQAQGHGLLRAAKRLWPNSDLERLEDLTAHSVVLWPLVLGSIVAALGLSSHDSALLASQSTISAPAFAALRLLGLDPFSVCATLARLSGAVDALAARAQAAASSVFDPSALPCPSSPLQELAAEAHARWEVRLFAS